MPEIAYSRHVARAIFRVQQSAKLNLGLVETQPRPKSVLQLHLKLRPRKWQQGLLLQKTQKHGHQRVVHAQSTVHDIAIVLKHLVPAPDEISHGGVEADLGRKGLRVISQQETVINVAHAPIRENQNVVQVPVSDPEQVRHDRRRGTTPHEPISQLVDIVLAILVHEPGTQTPFEFGTVLDIKQSLGARNHFDKSMVGIQGDYMVAYQIEI